MTSKGIEPTTSASTNHTTACTLEMPSAQANVDSLTRVLKHKLKLNTTYYTDSQTNCAFNVNSSSFKKPFFHRCKKVLSGSTQFLYVTLHSSGGRGSLNYVFSDYGAVH
jgi:transposase-like protein